LLFPILLGVPQDQEEPPVVERTAQPAFDARHVGWDQALREFVKEGLVDYAGFKARDGSLRGYLEGLASIPADKFDALPRAERLAYWINAYNAFTVRLILDHYPVKSIKDIGGLFRSPFKKEFIALPNLRRELLSLDDIEHGILRPQFADPRVHFAIVCASKGCPPLRSEAYRAEVLETQLDDQARRFLADPGKNRVDVEAKTLHLSPIFKWFREDFEKSAGSVPKFVARFLGPKTAAAIGDGVGWEIEYTDYDWTLNGN
ncbi:MAG TPA: DUF547 domain-containing protein, partial [Planctomycetota bacterium]|nr:DUF547 domain-containing protein [Planctomycetota bacterium]